MPIVLVGVLFLILALQALGKLARTKPQRAARIARATIGTAMFLGGAYMFVRSKLASPFGAGAFAFNQKRKAPDEGRWSEARSHFIKMRLDHDTGAMDGEALGGGYAGRALRSLSLAESLNLLDACRRQDPDGARLLETYLDRRFTAWRQAEQGQPNGGGGRRGSGGSMTRQQAYQALGLQDGASGEEIIRAHRSLMKKFHPDRGGATEQAALVNQAKDVLLTRHGTP